MNNLIIKSINVPFPVWQKCNKFLVFSLLLWMSAASVFAEERSEHDSDQRAGSAAFFTPVEIQKVSDYIYMAKGVANVYVVKTREGNVVIDTGFERQSAEQMRQLTAAVPGKTKVLVLTHMHFDPFHV